VERHLPVIQLDVPGPGGQAGFLLIAPRNEAIDWDIQNEIASTSRHWLEEHQAWWVAAYYLATARDIVHRFAPPAPAPVAAALPGTQEPPVPATAPVPAAPRPWTERLVALLRLAWAAAIRSAPPPRPPERPARPAPPSPAR